MPTPTYTPLATVTLGSSAASVTFSSIPATYRDLILVANCTATVAGNIHLRLNADSASNYSWVYMLGTLSTTASGAGTDTGIFGGGVGTAVITQSIFQLMDSSATDKHKTVLNRTAERDAASYAWANRWANTAAITSILVRMNNGSNFTAGSNFSLYGVIA